MDHCEQQTLNSDRARLTMNGGGGGLTFFQTSTDTIFKCFPILTRESFIYKE